MSNPDSKLPGLIAYTVRQSAEKSYWDRIGAAFPHKDGAGFDLVLDALPVNGRVTLRVPAERAETE